MGFYGMRFATSSKDTTTFTLKETDLTDKELGESCKTPCRDVPGSDGFQWWIEFYPAGRNTYSKKHVSVILCVNKSAKATFTVVLDDHRISRTDTYEFYGTQHLRKGFPRYAAHERLRPLFHNGILTITCSVEFVIWIPSPPFGPRNFQLFQHVPTDVEFVMGSDRVPVHKNFLSLISPTFNAMFSHNTTESKSGKIKVCDFDFDIVKTAIGLCYGHELKHLSVETVVKVLRFCDKYFITALTEYLELVPLANLTTVTFCDIVHYAYDCNKTTLLAECSRFFKKYSETITKQNAFAYLPPTLVIDVLKSSFNLKTNFDVLCHAHKEAINCVVNHLEQPLLESMTLDDFCPAVSYAWDCSRDDLKKICAQYLNDNRDEVLDLKAFYELPSDTAHKVLKASYDVKHGKQ